MRLFALEGVAADLFGFFCLVSGGVWFFTGLLFLANASFNNLGFPFFSTALNWGRATLGTVPPALIGAHFYGPKGVIAGVGFGSVVFGLVGIVLAFRTVVTLERRAGVVLSPTNAVEAPNAGTDAARAAAPAQSGALI